MNYRRECIRRAAGPWPGAAAWVLLVALLIVLPHLHVRAALQAAQTEIDTTFAVNTTDDNDDGCTRSHCTLREAIRAANTHPGPDRIVFDIDSGSQTIHLTTALPVISDTVQIDGTTQPGFDGVPLIELDGSAVTSTTLAPESAIIQSDGQRTGLDGLTIAADDCVVQGLALTRFRGSGIVVLSDQNTIQGNFLGVALDGATSRGNQRSGILVDGGAQNRIGGTDSGAGNLLSGNLASGIEVVGKRAQENRIQGNLIGTDHEGTRALSNIGGGVFINDAPANLVGGNQPGAGNLIAGNRANGIEVVGSSALENRIEGNLIGTDASGTFELGNANAGVAIRDARQTIVGGSVSGAGNVISANGADGIKISGSSAVENHIQGNLIGVDASGTRSIGNRGNGVVVSDAPGNIIGGDVPGMGNTIRYNGLHGVTIQGSDAPHNQVRGNTIASNERSGIFVVRSHVSINDNAILEHSTGIQVQGTQVTAAGNTLDGNGIALDLVSGMLRAYANNITGSTTAMRYLGGDFSGTHNWWGRASGVQPDGLEFAAWDARLLGAVDVWSEGTDEAVLGGATMRGGSGTAVIVQLERAPFEARLAAGATLASKRVCSDFYHFFAVDGSGVWDVTIPIAAHDACAGGAEDWSVYRLPTTIRCSDVAIAECWSLLPPEEVITGTAHVEVTGLSTSELDGTVMMAGNLGSAARPDSPAATATPTAPTATPVEAASAAPPATDEPAEDVPPRWMREEWPNPWLPLEFRYILLVIGVVGLLNVLMVFVIAQSRQAHRQPESGEGAEHTALPPEASAPPEASELSSEGMHE